MLKKKTKTLNETLLEAAKKGDDKVVTSCIDSGADIETKDDIGRTALHLASSKGNLSTIKLLLDLGANIHATDNKLQTALHYGGECKGIDGYAAATLLVQKGADIKMKDREGHTVLFNIMAKQITENSVYDTSKAILYESLVLAQEHIKNLEKQAKQQDICIEELQKEVKLLNIQMQKLTEQKALTTKNDDSSFDKKSYSPNFSFQNK